MFTVKRKWDCVWCMCMGLHCPCLSPVCITQHMSRFQHHCDLKWLLFFDCIHPSKHTSSSLGNTLHRAIIYDNDEENSGSYVDMVKDGYDYVVNIPSLYLVGRDGHNIMEALEQEQHASAVISLPMNASTIAYHDFTPWTQW
jgi:hypothetical protein